MQPILVQVGRLAVHAEERRAGRHELPEGRHELEPAARSSGFLDECLRADLGDHTGLPGRHDGKRSRLGLELSALVRVLAVEKLACLLADELDERRDAKRLPDVVHVDDKNRDAGDHEQERGHDRNSRHLAGAVAVVGHLAGGEDGVNESGDEQADRELARLVAQDALDDARGELTHRELDDDHRDRQHQCGQADHRCRDGGEDHDCSIGSAGHAGRERLVIEVAVERDRRERQERAGEHAQNRHEPEARLEVDEQLRESHAALSRIPVRPRQ